MTVKIGWNAPAIEGDSVVGNGEFSTFSLSAVNGEGKWAVVYFYPLDFTFV